MPSFFHSLAGERKGLGKGRPSDGRLAEKEIEGRRRTGREGAESGGGQGWGGGREGAREGARCHLCCPTALWKTHGLVMLQKGRGAITLKFKAQKDATA